MFEVFSYGDKWKWRLICAEGRELMVSHHAYNSVEVAAYVAKKMRDKFFKQAGEVDHRQGAAI